MYIYASLQIFPLLSLLLFLCIINFSVTCISAVRPSKCITRLHCHLIQCNCCPTDIRPLSAKSCILWPRQTCASVSSVVKSHAVNVFEPILLKGNSWGSSHEIYFLPWKSMVFILVILVVRECSGRICTMGTRLEAFIHLRFLRGRVMSQEQCLEILEGLGAAAWFMHPQLPPNSSFVKVLFYAHKTHLSVSWTTKIGFLNPATKVKSGILKCNF